MMHHIGEQNHKAAQQHFFRMSEEVILGQMLDVKMTLGQPTTMENIKIKSFYKTASYTFLQPLLAGAALAGVIDEHELDLIRQMGTSIGIAFQYRDDLKDMDNVHDNKDIFNDIAE